MPYRILKQYLLGYPTESFIDYTQKYPIDRDFKYGKPAGAQDLIISS